MIRIHRPAAVPAVLTNEGATARAQHCDEFAKGKKEFTFDREIYAHETVKKALVSAQHAKCCFCESKVTHVASGHIEHFRPKGAVRQDHAAKLEKPGYFWLAYEWTNLLFSCEPCNSRFKKNAFPLADATKRARDPADDLGSEESVFIDPAHEDPEQHLGYRREYPYAKNGSARGEATWKTLGLDREALAERRRDLLKIVTVLKAFRDLNLPKDLRASAVVQLAEMSKPSAEWSVMVRAALAEV